MTESKRVFTDLQERRHGGVRYFVGGQGAPLVLVHGLGGWAGNWRAVAARLVGDHRLIVPELPGHGGSEPLGSPLTATRFSAGRRRLRRRRFQPLPGARSLDPFVDAVLDVVAAEDALPARWVGHSLGALVGIHAAVRRPEAVRALVLAAAPGITSSTRLAEATLTVLGVTRPGRVLGKRSARVARSPRLRTLAFGGWGVADPVGLDPEAAAAFLEGPPQHRDTLTAGRALVGADPRLELERVECPCLCLWGASDNWVPLQDGIEYARRLRAPLRAIADCGHLLIGERPDAVAAAIRRFLGSVDVDCG